MAAAFLSARPASVMTIMGRPAASVFCVESGSATLGSVAAVRRRMSLCLLTAHWSPPLAWQCGQACVWPIPFRERDRLRVVPQLNKEAQQSLDDTPYAGTLHRAILLFVERKLSQAPPVIRRVDSLGDAVRTVPSKRPG